MAREMVVLATLVAMMMTFPAASAGPDDPHAVLGATNTLEGFDLQWAVTGNVAAVESFTLQWGIDGEFHAEFNLPSDARDWFIPAGDEEGFMHEFQLTVHTEDGDVTASNSAFLLNYPHCAPIVLQPLTIHEGCFFPLPP